jgi:hypothetical protein
MKDGMHFLVCLLFLTGPMHGQTLRVHSTQEIHPGIKADYTLSGVSPNGKSILVTKPHYQGLYLIDLKTGATKTLTEQQGAGYQPDFSDHSKYVCFRSDDFTHKIRLSSVYRVKLRHPDSTLLYAEGRNVTCPEIIGNDIIYSVDGKLKANHFHWWLFTRPDEKTFVQLQDLQPVLYQRGFKKTFCPSGEGSYLWVSLSPNRKRMVYYVVGKGAFVSDLNGKILLSAGDLMSPRWMNNDCVSGVAVHGDSGKSTATDVVFFSVKTGKRFVLTPTASINERNPYPLLKGKKMIYQTTSGALQLVTFSVHR